MKKIFSAVVALGLVFAISGCSFFAPKQSETFTVTAKDGALISINGTPMKSPATLTVPTNKSVSVVVSQKGYVPYSKTVNYKISSYGILDIVGGCFFLVPFAGLLSEGAWELDETSLNVNLIKED